jgi:hypothetical protein
MTHKWHTTGYIVDARVCQSSTGRERGDDRDARDTVLLEVDGPTHYAR